MNIKRNIFAMLAAAVLLASCSQDEVMTDTGPDGLVPVTLSAAVGDGVQTRIVSADEDDDLRYCYAQVCDENGETLEGYAQLIPLEKGDGGKYTGNIYLRPNKTYVFLFWADNSSMYTPSDLHKVSYQKGCIAFAGRVEQTISFNDPTVDATLQHVVSKVTLKTTTNVSEIKKSPSPCPPLTPPTTSMATTVTQLSVVKRKTKCSPRYKHLLTPSPARRKARRCSHSTPWWTAPIRT